MSVSPQTRDMLDSLAAGSTTSDVLRRVSCARSEVEAAYVAARHLVYDRFPAGPIDRQALTPLQLDAVVRLDIAERELEHARLAYHQGPHERVIRLD